MKGMKKYLVAVCVLALSCVLFAGCSSGQSSSSAASASASAATTEDLIKELEAVPGLENYDSVTIDMKGNTSIDMSAMLGGLSGSESSSSSSASSSESNAMDIPTDILMKVAKSQEGEKMFVSMDMMGFPFELYIEGDNVVMVVQGQAFSGTLQELESMGMSNYGSVNDIMTSNGAGDFSQYKDAVESISKQTVNGETVYTVVVDLSKIDNEAATSAFSQLGLSGDSSKLNLTYTVGTDGKLTAATMDMSGTGFSMNQDMTFSDYNTTVVPDAPEATTSLSDLAGLMGGAAQS